MKNYPRPISLLSHPASCLLLLLSTLLASCSTDDSLPTKQVPPIVESQASSNSQLHPQGLRTIDVRAQLIGNSAAIYLGLSNSGTESKVLVEAAFGHANSTGLHETVDDNGVIRMRSRPEVEILPGETVTFAPGGIHIMALELPVGNHSTMPLLLSFADGQRLELMVPTRVLVPRDEPVGAQEDGQEDSHEH